MKKSHIYIAGLVSALAGCGKGPAIIVMDNWWNEDYAKTACRMMKDNSPECEAQQVSNVRDFERDLATQLAALPICEGVKLTTFSGPMNDSTSTAAFTKGAYWSLNLNYTSGAPTQQWQMLESPAKKTVMQGQGTPAEIAMAICSIVKGNGAKLM